MQAYIVFNVIFIKKNLIKIIKRMRDFNCAIKLIQDLKDSLYEEIKIDSIEHKEQLEKVILKIARSEGYSEDEVKQTLLSEEVKEELSKFRIRLLKIYILDVTILKSHFALIFNSKGEFFPYRERYFSELQKNNKFQEFIQNSHISISLTEILSDFILSIKKVNVDAFGSVASLQPGKAA